MLKQLKFEKCLFNHFRVDFLIARRGIIHLLQELKIRKKSKNTNELKLGRNPYEVLDKEHFIMML